MKQLEPCNDCGKTHPFFECDKPKPMTNEERIKADAERFTKDEGYQKVYIAGATAYASDRHQLQQENTELRRQNDKLKQQAEGWRPLLEEVLSKHGAIILMHDSEFHEKIKKFLYGE